MKFLWKYLKKYRWMILFGMGLKLAGTLTELLIPYVMEHLLDHVVPQKETAPVLLWGGAMILLACVVRFLNVTANRKAVWIAKESIFTIRRDLFHSALNLSGGQTDEIGLPSLNGYYMKNNVSLPGYSISVDYESDESLLVMAGGNAADECVFDLAALVDYAFLVVGQE